MQEWNPTEYWQIAFLHICFFAGYHTKFTVSNWGFFFGVSKMVLQDLTRPSQSSTLTHHKAHCHTAWPLLSAEQWSGKSVCQLANYWALGPESQVLQCFSQKKCTWESAMDFPKARKQQHFWVLSAARWTTIWWGSSTLRRCIIPQDVHHVKSQTPSEIKYDWVASSNFGHPHTPHTPQPNPLSSVFQIWKFIKIAG